MSWKPTVLVFLRARHAYCKRMAKHINPRWTLWVWPLVNVLGVLLLGFLTLDDAIAACQALWEQLWSPSPDADIPPNLDYLSYQGKCTDTQKYWIASNASRTQTINGHGNTQSQHWTGFTTTFEISEEIQLELLSLDSPREQLRLEECLRHPGAWKYVATIPQSNLGGLKDGTYSLYRTIAEEVADTANALLGKANCTGPGVASQLECLSALPAYTLTSLSGQAQTLVIDVATPEFVLNSSKSVATVHLLMGVVRDEGGTATKWPPTTSNFSVFISQEGFNATLVQTAGYSITSTGNASLDIFNASIRVGTDGEWWCVDQATVFARLHSNLFQNIYFYEFDRSYAPTTDTRLCKAPFAPSIFENSKLRSPDNEYFKCHGAQMYYIFGTVGWNGLPLWDENDLPFEQFVVDSWTSLARTHVRNPDPAFLKARGFTNTMRELEVAGRWKTLSADSLTQRELQWPSFEIEFVDVPQCAALGYPTDYYFKN
ncbi:uncharacterized protein PAC_06709 [Phialocephala subalpina]|uniref:Uncharacterized protein n=1 Tax=Phialocephala subalpina TaxID=576137 RepID=A0A1L7WVM0_9HELO|nr:uncharacterized protein PAC_06709 [Phialocephala subalpina]